MPYIGIAADPGEIELLLQQQVHDLAITAALNEADGATDASLEVIAPVVEEGELVVEKHRGEADSHRGMGLRVGA